MSTRINHNVLSLAAQRNLQRTQFDMDKTVARLSSGLRINKAWEDPAGLAISEKFRSQIASMDEAERNANYDMNLIDTAEGALSIIDEMLIRMRALAVQSANGALTDDDRSKLDLEFQQLKSEITRISESTNYNTKVLLDGSYSDEGIVFHIGPASSDNYSVAFSDMRVSALGLSDGNLATINGAQSAIDSVDDAISSKDNERTRLGSYVERLQHTVHNLQISRENATKSESEIRDADIAAEMSTFVRGQILSQSGVAMLTQANMVPQQMAGLIG